MGPGWVQKQSASEPTHLPVFSFVLAWTLDHIDRVPRVLLCELPLVLTRCVAEMVLFWGIEPMCSHQPVLSMGGL